jgi:hypothetical protein
VTTLARHRAIALFFIAIAATAFNFGGAPPATAYAERTSVEYMVMEVPTQVIDDLVAVQLGAKHRPGWPIPPELDLTYKLCGDFQCICINIDPCEPDSAQLPTDRLVLASSIRTPAVLDLVNRELKSKKYPAVKLCSTFQSQYVGCVTARLPQK